MRVAYPLTLTFKFLTISSYIRVVDATGELVSYVKQNESDLRHRRNVLDRRRGWPPLGAVRQRGMRTFWKATYDILDEAGNAVGLIHEQDVWVWRNGSTRPTSWTARTA